MSDKKYNGVFKVGFARVDISPTRLPIRATESRSKFFTMIKDPLLATCVALHDGTDTALIITLDLKGTYEYIITNVVDRIMKATGLPKENIMVSAIHNHSAPASSDDGDNKKFDWDKGIYEWLDEVFSKMGALATEAIEDMVPAEIYTARKDTTGMAHVRRYIHADGGFSAIQCKEKNSTPIVAHETDADAELQIVRFARAGKKDVVLTNWQAHVAHAVGHFSDLITADLVFYARREVERGDKVLYAYFAGASGNINLNCRAPKEGMKRYASYVEVGEGIGALVNEALAEPMKKINAGKINAAIVSFGAKTRKDSAERIEDAMAVAASGYDKEVRRQKGFISSYHVNAYLDRAELGESEDIPLGVITLGDLAFVGAPYEMFDTNGMEVKEGSPFETTFVLSCAGGNYDYMPSRLAFSHGGYEVFRCRYVEGTAEQLSAAFVAELNRQRGE